MYVRLRFTRKDGYGLVVGDEEINVERCCCPCCVVFAPRALCGKKKKKRKLFFSSKINGEFNSNRGEERKSLLLFHHTHTHTVSSDDLYEHTRLAVCFLSLEALPQRELVSLSLAGRNEH